MRGLNLNGSYSTFSIPLVLPTIDHTRVVMSEPPSTSVNKCLQSNLLSLQISFFQSLQSGPDALAAFHGDMLAFNEAVSRSEQHLEEDTRLMIYSFAQMSNAVIPELIDLYATSDKLTEDMNKVFDELSLDDPTYTGLSPLLLIWHLLISIYSRTRNIPTLHSTRVRLASE